MSERRAWNWDAKAREAFDEGLDAELRDAVAQGDIGILFQPQVRIADAAIVGVEALARWQHPTRGELGADLLFTVAARSRFMVPLSAHVQRAAACLAAGWGDTRTGLRLSLNVGAQDLAEPAFVEDFLASVRQCEFPLERLTVEVTESELVVDLEQAARALARLREQGIRIALDDFGTGYASLAYLSALPLDTLKLDKALIDGLEDNARQRVVIEATIELARRLQLSVVAEGVETGPQHDFLAAAGCDYYQGFLCAPPLDDDALAAFVRERAAPTPSKVAARH